MDARYLDPDRRAVEVTLPAGETLGTMAGPATFRPGMAEGNAEHDALMGLVAAGAVEIAAFVAPAPAVPDDPTLSDWRVGLTLWGRIDDVTGRVAALATSSKPQEAMLGKIAKERLEYANTVQRAHLLALKDALGFTEAEIDESLWRADRVRQGDLSGTWPVKAA